MSLKKLFFMLATGVCVSLFTAAPAYACTGGHTLHEATHGDTVTDADAPFEVGDATRPEQKGAQKAGATKFRRGAAAPLQEEEEIFGSCIHGGGDCHCVGPRTHRSRCGSSSDCETHPGLVCTWG